jgi:hypothetical protein
MKFTIDFIDYIEGDTYWSTPEQFTVQVRSESGDYGVVSGVRLVKVLKAALKDGMIKYQERKAREASEGKAKKGKVFSRKAAKKVGKHV